MVTKEEALDAHSRNKGKYEIVSKVPVASAADLSTYYTPGVAYVSQAIAGQRGLAYEYTTKANSIAIVSDGTRILGLGDIGPEAGLPVMEGKAILFKKFGGVDAIPICIGTKDEDEIVKLVTWLAPTFGAVNIEDISSPKAFRVVERLSSTLDIPVFHDDNHGTGVVALAGLINAFRLAGKGKDARIVVNGSGSAGMGISRQLLAAGFRNLIVVDSKGAIYEGRDNEQNPYKADLAKVTNAERRSGGLGDVVAGADALIGASAKGAFTKDMIALMADKPVVFALANPESEIEYESAKDAGAFVVATGRSDRPNQVNNLLAFPGIMRGLLDSRAKEVNARTLNAAAMTIAKSVGSRLSQEFIMPSFTDRSMAIKVASSVAEAVAQETARQGLARLNPEKGAVKAHTREILKRYSKLERRLVKNEASGSA
jgi:malate dehydrogenase (oxaloacetate-decarboxylating)